MCISKSHTPVRNYNNLAMGSRGDFRFIELFREGDERITKVGMLRLQRRLTHEEIESRIQQSGFTQYSDNINEGRGGDYLYLLWAH